MEIPGKCPSCGKAVPKAELIKVPTDTNATKLYGPLPSHGLAYVCPNPLCRVILPVLPIAEKAT